MPVYEYRCTDCEKTFEQLVRSQSQKIECPTCGREHVSRVFSTFAVGASTEKGPRCESPQPGCGRCWS
jgi:putative FmdB family regulatory protein